MVEIRSGVLAWGPLHISGAGALTLDPALQPHAQLNTHVRGHRDTLSALAAGGAITPEDAALAKIALGLMETAPADGSGPVAELPISVTGRTVYAGPLALLTHPPILWP
jgi:hypothetical protein